MNAYIPGDAVLTPCGRGFVVEVGRGVRVQLPGGACWFEFYEVRLAA